MDTLEAIAHVRVVRSYRDEPLPTDLLRTIADAGRHAGSSKNRQAWAFVIVQAKPALVRLSSVGPYASHLADAPAAIALVTPAADAHTSGSVLWDLGRAAQNMVLAAWAMGIGSCPVTVYEPDLAAGILALPEDRRCPYVLALGWPADASDLTRAPRAGGRRSYDDVVHEERW